MPMVVEMMQQVTESRSVVASVFQRDERLREQTSRLLELLEVSLGRGNVRGHRVAVV
jgi:hypothetical protein